VKTVAGALLQGLDSVVHGRVVQEVRTASAG
jgi:hypothetical protein